MSRPDLLIDRILIVGLGSIGRRHLSLARDRFPRADIRVLRHQAHNDVPLEANGVFSLLDEAVAFSPQLAVIANPAPFHVPVAAALASVGCHFLVEKPLADTWQAGASLLKKVEDASRIFLLGYNLRYMPSLQQFREYYKNGIVGRALSVRCEIGQYLPSWRPGSDYRQGVSAQRELGGGVLLELSHELDYLYWIFGEVRWVRATLGKQSDLEIEVEDTAHLTLAFSGEAEGELLATLNLDFIRHDTTRQCTIIGENGSVRWNGVTGSVEHYRAGETAWRPLFTQMPQRNQSYLAEWQHMVACIEGSELPMVGISDGLHTLKIIEAARLSCRAAGAEVSIEDIQ